MNGDEITPGDLPSLRPSEKIDRVFEQVEMMALHKGDGLDFNTLNDGQKDKVLEVMQTNEDHAFEYNTQKLQNDKEIKLAKINAGIFNHRTNRYTFISISAALFIVTVLILFFKESFFNQWITFITGLIGGSLGGYGYAKNSKNNVEG